MANVFYFGYTLTNNDLVSYFLNASEEFYDPYYVAYTIFYINSNYNIIIGQEDRVPIRISIGQYRPAFTIPTTWSEGEYCIRWKSKNSATCSSIYKTDKFYVFSIYGLSGIDVDTVYTDPINPYYNPTGMNWTGTLCNIRPEVTIGDTGIRGHTGAQGYTGLGATGLQGPQGTTGPQGYTGLGLTGLGITGLIGPTGAIGTQGETGIGWTGSIGPQGDTGVGYIGADGATGPQGYTGAPNETLGTPSDGGWTGGLFNWTPVTLKSDALDDVNEALKYLAPDDASSLDSTSLVISNTTLYSARLSDGNINYKSGAGVGSTIAYVLTDANFNFTNATSPATFNKADEGTLKLYINGVLKDSFDLASDFDESYRSSTQVYTPKNSPLNYITITSVGYYNTFPLWQRGMTTLNIAQADLRQGWNYIKLVHDELSVSQETTEYDVFYDQGVNAATVTTPIITENMPVFRWLSGVKFYYRGSTFNLSGTASNIFDNTFYPTAPYSYTTTSSTMGSGSVDWDDATVSGISNPPAITDATMTITNKVLTVPSSNVRSTNARVTVTSRKAWSTSSSSSSASANRLIDAYDTNSNGLNELFNDENRRLTSGSYDTIPGSITGVWNSETVLSNGNLQVYNGSLIYPITNYSSGYLPTQSANYSAFSGNQVYYRAFYKASTPKSSGVYEILGIVAGDVAQVGSGNINVEIKLPTQTGWLDLGKAYDSGTFTGIDSDGCKTAQSVNSWSWTCGSFSTADSGYMVIVRVTFRVNTVSITSLKETSW